MRDLKFPLTYIIMQKAEFTVALQNCWIYWCSCRVLYLHHSRLEATCTSVSHFWAIFQSWDSSFFCSVKYLSKLGFRTLCCTLCCDMGQNDTIGKIELIPLCLLSTDNTNCKIFEIVNSFNIFSSYLYIE